MDPYQNQRDDRNQQNPGRTTIPVTPGTSGGDQTPVDPGREDPEARNTPANNREPQYSVGFTMIPPNESRRSKTQMMAQKELDELQKWREDNKPKPVQPVSEKLGGNATLSAVREKQHLELHHAKLQKKLKQQEADKKKRQEEDEENQKMKDKQRERAELLEERRSQEDQRRRDQHRPDHMRKTERFLQRFDRSVPSPLVSGGAAHTPSQSEAASGSVRDMQRDHRRVNTAFLDTLEGRGKETKEETKSPFSASEDLTYPSHLNPEPEHSYLEWSEEAEPDLKRLMESFPGYSSDFLEDILVQCNRDCEQAYALLLNCAMD
ncbi:epithelial-stromal interaction protein 1 [Pseudochaenichthys georgianus]|uniref:epithelial-stromal interaction protein 1 n=1 Tax=Pseudochaenichthys georgianus TaxID=52239 RepID=UPI00146DDE06|nr:epithelial-stromal interaction protein 1 [Pseudochaenichthys georgianus]